MIKQTVSLVAVFLTGAAMSASACASCGCAAPKPKASACPAAACSKAEKAACTKSAKSACSAKAKATCGKSKCGKAAKACCPSKKAAADHGYALIGTDGLKALLASDEKVTLVDARSGKYDDGRRIGSAQQLAANSSDEAIAKALPNKDAKIVAYCTSTKCPASAALAHKLVDLGYKNVVKYPDGINAWVDAGNPVKKAN